MLFIVAGLVTVGIIFLTDPNNMLTDTDTSDSDLSVSVSDVFSYEIYNIGDTFTMGEYEQNANKEDGSEPIEWVVLDKSDRGIFVMSQYALSALNYYYENTKYKYTTWETCYIRSYLNGEFYDEVFTDEERGYIMLTHNVNDDNVEYGTEGGNDTDDYVFLLSHDEVMHYFPERDSRRCHPTAQAIKEGAHISSNPPNTYWWLRSPGKFRCNAEYVFDSGVVYTYGSDVGHVDVCMRPAMWLSFRPEA